MVWVAVALDDLESHFQPKQFYDSIGFFVFRLFFPSYFNDNVFLVN